MLLVQVELLQGQIISPKDAKEQFAFKTRSRLLLNKLFG